MNAGTVPLNELYKLLGALCDDSLTALQGERLEQILAQSSDACERYLEFIELNVHLTLQFSLDELEIEKLAAQVDQLPASSAEALRTGSVVPLAEPARRGWRTSQAWDWFIHPTALSALIAGLFVTAVVLALALWTLSPVVMQPVERAPAPFVAEVIGDRAPVWQLKPGAAAPTRFVPGQEVELLDGLVELELFRGAKAIIEGPARFTVLNDNTLGLMHGVASFKVPRSAQGFLVETPALKVVDLGTEFGMAVAPDETVDLHVFRGTVAATPTDDDSGAARVVLKGGEAARFKKGAVAPTDSRMPAERFVTNLHSPNMIYRRPSCAPMNRLEDKDGDRRGDSIRVGVGLAAVGEWNNPSNPQGNEGRLWIPFQLNNADLHNIEHGIRVLARFEVKQTQGIPLNMAAYGVRHGADHQASAADYERAGTKLADDLLARVQPSGGVVVCDVTEFVQQAVREGDRQFALRLQVDSPQLPNAGNTVDNALIQGAADKNSDGPLLLIHTPRQHYQPAQSQTGDAAAQF